ncbi:Myb-like DNA-binding domain containing protein [Trichomonas vaginalis G3]|uniref:Myb-like DNA-binding domain containing protein n=1 Tax=Trichomonas vaginalis (strain ATCC PRA-98 / G3) TaxID=412133 RepID=A2FQL5_TRIV3|nr:homeodomain-like family [Trichomonas vaginalis G3]EAX92790.1 Myb-like DNA-binding domain containing protein [Trichomonas vaginalis G3]KAI5483718.1 homeodomain-like family [Trichomonas vaginalis G3]|eukprot:XP_001305720.1 Myb-like DNA-binding domain containing protein [Trichomonas vaginalis G3]
MAEQPPPENDPKNKRYKLPQQGPQVVTNKRPLTEEEKLIIVEYFHKWGKQWTKIAKLIGRNESTVRKWYESFRRTGRSHNPPGRIPMIGEPIIEQVLMISSNEPSLTLEAISKKVGISKSSVHNILHQNDVK